MTVIEGMVFLAVVAFVVMVGKAWWAGLRWRRSRSQRERRLAQELAEFAEHPTFRWDDRERR